MSRSDPSIKLTDRERTGGIESVDVDGQVFTGRVYHVRRNGWACIESPAGRVASGPAPHCACGVAIGSDVVPCCAFCASGSES